MFLNIHTLKRLFAPLRLCAVAPLPPTSDPIRLVTNHPELAPTSNPVRLVTNHHELSPDNTPEQIIAPDQKAYEACMAIEKVETAITHLRYIMREELSGFIDSDTLDYLDYHIGEISEIIEFGFPGKEEDK